MSHARLASWRVGGGGAASWGRGGCYRAAFGKRKPEMFATRCAHPYLPVHTRNCSYTAVDLAPYSHSPCDRGGVAR